MKTHFINYREPLRTLRLIVLLSSWYCYSFSQTNCETPLPPVFTGVSVQPETGRAEFTWTLSPSTGVAAYILYTYKNGDGMAFDTLWNPNATSFTISSTEPKDRSVSYVIAAYRLPGIPSMPGCPSQLSNVLNTIFANADLDTCNKKIIVSWNNYPSSPKKVVGYSLLMSVNGSIFAEAGRTGPDEYSFTMNDFVTSANYCFIVRANLEDGTISTSNKVCLYTRMQRPPEWINADYATVNTEKGISLSFTFDQSSEITRFRLERKVGISGTFTEIAQPASSNGKVIFTDDKADINVINAYRLSAINNCNNPVTVSNICSNIILTLKMTNNDMYLSWNSYREWNGDIAFYRLFINTGKGFDAYKVFSASDTTYILGYKELMYEVTGNEVCFYTSASETLNPYGIYGMSNSSVICTTPTELITVPNIFTPGKGTVNSSFKPVLSFTPVEYHLVITNRQGKVLFESRDFNETWDGAQNGKIQPQEVFLWFLKVTTPSGKSISKTGTLTTFNSR